MIFTTCKQVVEYNTMSCVLIYHSCIVPVLYYTTCLHVVNVMCTNIALMHSTSIIYSTTCLLVVKVVLYTSAILVYMIFTTCKEVVEYNTGTIHECYFSTQHSCIVPMLYSTTYLHVVNVMCTKIALMYSTSIIFYYLLTRSKDHVY
jgi:hypothetical protein